MVDLNIQWKKRPRWSASIYLGTLLPADRFQPFSEREFEFFECALKPARRPGDTKSLYEATPVWAIAESEAGSDVSLGLRFDRTDEHGNIIHCACMPTSCLSLLQLPWYLDGCVAKKQEKNGHRGCKSNVRSASCLIHGAASGHEATDEAKSIFAVASFTRSGIAGRRGE